MPVTTDTTHFSYRDQVEVFHQNSWQLGVIVQVGYRGGDYLVKIHATGEKIRREWGHVRKPIPS